MQDAAQPVAVADIARQVEAELEAEGAKSDAKRKVRESAEREASLIVREARAEGERAVRADRGVERKEDAIEEVAGRRLHFPSERSSD